MLYRPNMDVTIGPTFVDNHNLFTHVTIETLTRFGNLVVTEKRMNNALASLYFQKNNTRLIKNNDGGFKKSTSEYKKAVRYLNNYIHSLTGFKVVIRRTSVDHTDCPNCVIIEKEGL